MLKIVTSSEMREMDRRTIEKIGVPGIVLMENAGVGAARVIQRVLEDLIDPQVHVFCGKGNNGGDGMVIARHLWDAGIEVQVFIIGKESDLAGDALTNFNIIKTFGIKPFFISKADDLFANMDTFPNLVVDALFGTGIKGAVRGFPKEVIKIINDFETFVVSVDVPSGLNADSPAVEGEVVKANATVTMALPKRCHVFHPAKSFVGELFIAEIGIPWFVRNSEKVNMQMVEERDIYLPERMPDSHKYKNGKVGILAGSPGFTGAATLTSQAALEIGAGMINLAVPESINPILENKLTEVITRIYSAGGGRHLTVKDLTQLGDFLEWCDVLAIGPGLGREAETQQAVIQILSEFKKKLVIDADALFAMANHPEILQKATPDWILTPHLGEFSRFLPDIDKEKLKTDFVELAQKFAKEHHLTLLLKGAPSIVVDSESEIYVNPTGNAGLASGGTGDVLTGLIAGLIAQDLEPDRAAFTANYLHGLCADEVADFKTVYSLKASDLIENMGKSLKKHFFSEE